MKKKLLLILLLLMFASVPALADLVGSGAVYYQPSIPTNLDLGKYESDTDIFVFDEQQNLILSNNLYVDIGQPDTYNDSDDLVGAGGTILAGTPVNCYLVHIDPIGVPGSIVTYSGSVTFSNKILGVIVETSTLNATDSVLGVGATTYYTYANRGL